jgi:iron(III) transport system substrate-binding protein
MSSTFAVMNIIRLVLILGSLITPGLSSLAFAQTQDQLIAGAKKEGRLVLYASAAVQQLQMYFAAFNKRYSFITTEYYRTDKQKLLSRILLEYRSKQHLADLIHTSVIETHIAKTRGALSRHVPNEAASYPSQYKDPQGYWTSVYASGTLMGFIKESTIE